MARQRRPGGFRPPELRGTLGTLLRTTLAQAGTLRDALERGAREGRNRLDAARSSRRRHDALAELGDIVLDLIRQGEIDLGELPEVRDIVAHLDEIDAADDAPDHDEPAPPPRSPRARFDARRRAETKDEDGTVSATTWSPPNRQKQAKPQKPQGVWRPPTDVAPDPAAGPGAASRDRQTQVTAQDRPLPKPQPRKGGITFDDDEDLAEYMHPADVPPKEPPDGDS